MQNNQAAHLLENLVNICLHELFQRMKHFVVQNISIILFCFKKSLSKYILCIAIGGFYQINKSDK